MATEKLTMVTLSGPRNMVDTALQRCVINRDFHLENAIEAMSGIKKLYPFELINPYSDLLQTAYRVMEAVGVSPSYSDFSSRNYTEENSREYFDRLSQSLDNLQKEQEILQARIEHNDLIRVQLQYMQGVEANLADLLNMKYVKFRFGRLPKENYTDAQAVADHRGDVFFIRTGEAQEWIYGMYLAQPSFINQIDALFIAQGFERIRIEGGQDFNGTAEEFAHKIEMDVLEAETKMKELVFMKNTLTADDAEELRARYSYVRFLSECYELRSYAGFRHETFYIMGWIPAGEAQAYANACQQIPGFSCILSNPKDFGTSTPPVKVKQGGLRKIFMPFLEMYGLPSYAEVDPTIFMALTYTLLFGIMFGDIGQGAVLCLVGMLMWKKKGMWLGRILTCVGGSAVLFGFVYGSVFGFEHILPGFKVLEDGNAMNILMVSVAIGVVLLLICMVFNVINGVRQRDLKKIFFSPNGVAGILFFGGIVFGAVSLALWGNNVFSLPYILIFVGLPLFCIFAAEPLTKLLEGKKNWLPESIGGFIVEGFFELFETLLAYISNTVSFLRIGAFAISHAGMMSVVFLLTNHGSNVVGLIVGNILVMGIEAVLVCIQVMRLEFYELFGRFYDSGGTHFSPHIITYEKAS